MLIDCFKSYDVRGVLGSEVSEEVFHRIGRATATVLGTKRLVIGYDARESSPSLSSAFQEGARSEGSDVFDIGLAGTEEVYFATSHFEADVGIMITASHNPINYNGIKFVGKGSRPLEVESEFRKIKEVAELIEDTKDGVGLGELYFKGFEAREAYVEKVLSFIDVEALSPLRIVVNCGNGAAGPALADIKKYLEIKGSRVEIIPTLEQPDSSFPNGVPNPILPQNHHYTAKRVISENADFGVAFDGDFDRCFFFDRHGIFIPGEIMVSLLGEFFSRGDESERIVHDPRLVFSVKSACERSGATAIQSPTGHLFMKKVMREHNAVYGGEISAHHYFRDFFYCDSGMIPWLLVASLLTNVDKDLTEIVEDKKRVFPSSGEINFSVKSTTDALAEVEAIYSEQAVEIDRTDGLSFLFDDWRFNIRASNTEPLLRLNVETTGNSDLLEAKVDEISTLIRST